MTDVLLIVLIVMVVLLRFSFRKTADHILKELKEINYNTKTADYILKELKQINYNTTRAADRAEG